MALARDDVTAFSDLPSLGTAQGGDVIAVNRSGQSTPAQQAVFPTRQAVLAFEYLGATIPVSSEVIGATAFVASVTFPGNFAGSSGAVVTNPASTFACLITKNGTTVGGMTISTLGAYTFTSTLGAAVTYVAGDTMTILAPVTPDASAANFLFSFLGTFN